ncbi:GIY-YIG nuclease family protein [Burkholderiaceae bacterium UC74_6]
MPGWDNKPRSYGNFDQNIGVPGVVYVLENGGLRSGFVKIGCTRYSGHKRASSLNEDANTGTPGTFRCTFEVRTEDCGQAERQVFAELAAHRRGKWGQEFFEVELAHAREVIERVCREIDAAAALEPSPPASRVVQMMSPPPWERPHSPSAKSRGPVRLVLTLALVMVMAGLFLWFQLKVSLLARQLTVQPAPQQAPVQRLSQAQPSPPKRPVQAVLVDAERASLDAACGNEKSARGPAAFAQCQQRLLDELAAAAPPVDLSGLSLLERSSMNSACEPVGQMRGPAGLRSCLADQVAKLKDSPDRIDLSRLSRDMRMSIDAVCSHAKHTLGPADYYQCAANHLREMGWTSP